MQLVKRQMTRLGLRQKDLAAKTGISASMISTWLNGKVRVTNARSRPAQTALNGVHCVALYLGVVWVCRLCYSRITRASAKRCGSG